MGRDSTGAITNNQAKRIELSYLLKNSLIKANSRIQSTLKWNYNGSPSGSISIITDTTTEIHTLRVIYSYKNPLEDEKKDYDYCIELCRVKSNLGKGFRYYFLCPVTFRRSTILYMAYGSPYFKCRTAYRVRIYYECQRESKKERTYKYMFYENQIDQINSKIRKSNYKGKLTKSLIRIKKLEMKMEKNWKDLFN